MFFLKSIFLIIAVVATVLSAQEIDSLEEMEEMELEALEDLPSTDSSNAQLMNEESKEAVKDTTELNFYITSQGDELSSPSTSKSSEETTKSMSDTIDAKEDNSETIVGTTESTSLKSGSVDESTEQMAIIFEEIDESLMDTQSNESTQSSMIQTSTDSKDITSEYNGFDANKSETTFSCYGRPFGQYADVQKECRVFHLCYPYFNSTTDELLYQRISFLCDNDSVFDQKRFICVDNSTVEHKCSDSEALYLQTNQEYLIRVFSQSVSPIDEMKGQQNQGSDRNWMSWLYPH